MIPFRVGRPTAATEARRFRVVTGVLLLAVLPQFALAATGRTSGEFSVTSTGVASYGIPLTLPPGTNELKPSLSLQYNHTQSNGLLGMGWSISGLSAIVRCHKTVAQDGAISAATLATSDGYCLDGNRLRLTGGSYGLANSTYQTEIETFTRVTAKSAAGNGPAWWEAHAKDGLIYEYGNSADSRIETVGSSTARLWAINRIKDRAGNYIEFKYTEETGNGSFRPLEILYTGNVGIAAVTKIAFTYGTVSRPDPQYGYRFGTFTPLVSGNINEFKRLEKIEAIHIPTSEVVRSYTLTYEPGGGAGARSRLQWIQECAGTDCLPRTDLLWINGTASWPSAETTTGQPVATAANALVMDINGDGRDDLVYSSSTTSGGGNWMYMLGTASGYNAPTNTLLTNWNYTQAQAIEWNGDGLADVLVPCNGTGFWCVLQSTGAGFTNYTPTTAPSTGSDGWVLAADIDGDGRDDLVRIIASGLPHKLGLRLRDASGFTGETIAWTAEMPIRLTQSFVILNRRFQGSIRRMDFDGDGRQDFTLRVLQNEVEPGVPDTNYWLSFFGSGNAISHGPVVTTSTTTNAPYAGDFNGDGLSDLAFAAGNSWLVVTSRGRAFASLSGPPLTGTLFNQAVMADYDGDGLTDIVVPKSSPASWFYSRATGNGFAALTDLGLGAAAMGSPKAADINGDGLVDIARNDTASSNHWKFRLHNGVFPDLLDRATDGYGMYVDFNYAALTSGSPTYTKGSTAVFPTQEYQGPMRVVSGYTATDGIGGTYTMTYSYEQARYHVQGRGFLGFGKHTGTDSRNGVRTETTYLQDPAEYQAIGAASVIQVKQGSGTPITETTNTWSKVLYGSGATERRFPFISQQVVKRYEVGEPAYDGDLVSTATTVNVIDATSYGTVYDSTTTTVEAGSANGIQNGASYVARFYHPVAQMINDAGLNWCIGRPGRTERTQSHSETGGAAITRTVSRAWDAIKCRLTQEIVEPDSTSWKITTDFTYDDASSETDPDVGNVTRISVTGIGMSPRTTLYSWAPTSGRFLASVTNALSQTTSFGWDAPAGTLASTTDPNGLVTSWDYDWFTRPVLENRPDDTDTTWTYEDCSISGCVNANNKLVVIERQRDASDALVRDEWAYFDRFERAIALKSRSLSNASGYEYSRRNREYDALGRVYRESAPCWWTSCVNYWTTFTYDVLDRVTLMSRPTSDSDSTPAETRSYFEGLRTRTVDALGKQSTRISNVVGGLAQSSDHAGYSQTFDVDGFGNVVQVTDSLSNVLQTATYNIQGVKTAQTDMDMGAWTYLPNALGELEKIRDAKTTSPNWTSILTYDPLGRITSRQDVPEGITSTFTWGAAIHNDATHKYIGRLKQMSTPGYSEVYTNDADGRLQSTQITSDATYTIDHAYNAMGLLHTLTYPTSTSGYRLKLQYDYQNGLLKQVKDFNAPTLAFWTANDVDPRGAVISEAFGNTLQRAPSYDLVTGLVDSITTGPAGSIQSLLYAWDKVGNLTQRQDQRQGLTESFQYDDLHRLKLSTGPDPISVTYDLMGNIQTKTGIAGTYTYHATKKHAVAVAGSSTFAYDANGNVSSRNGSPITWYSYNLPNTISASGSNSSQFFYAPDRSRWKQVASYGGTTETTIYIGGLIEKVTLGAVTSWKHYIGGGSGPVAIYTRKSGAADEMHYLTRDHLGSVDTVTNSAGAVEVRLSYGAFGQRRREAGWAGNPLPADWTEITDTTRRGFTFHEMLDNLNLIHMNGRVYDQIVGRFLSADPIVQAPAFTQSFNRYSYVFNSPLSFTDPSGFQGIGEDAYPPSNRYWGISAGHNARPGAPNREDPADVRESRPGYTGVPAPGTGTPTPTPSPRPNDLTPRSSVVACPGDFIDCMAHWVKGPPLTIPYEVEIWDWKAGSRYSRIEYAEVERCEFYSAEGCGVAATQSPLDYITPLPALRSAASTTVWRGFSPMTRGRLLEFFAGAHLGRTFPVIDRFVRSTGVATSIKSLDLRMASYQTTSGLKSTIMRYVKALEQFQGAVRNTAAVRGGEISSRQLELIVPRGISPTAGQLEAIDSAAREALGMGIEIVVIPF